ncbi:MAG: dihydrofolate reductase family protein [Candidatus Bathyarchaeota archaeon]|nr:dihydrofolate reductase family protein [Candidatus Bathyarchaeota archaeon]
MLPKVVLHNSVSLDGSLTNFEPNLQVHYSLAGRFESDAHLVGSNTMKVGVELFNVSVPLEEESDFKKPKRDPNLPYWFIPDTKCVLMGILHTCRRLEYCRDVVVLVSEQTSQEYVEHLVERNYDYHVVGKDHIDLKRALSLISEKYGAKTVLVDAGRILGNLLLNQGLVDEISLLVHPVIVGTKSYNIFEEVNNLNLELIKNETFDKNLVWLVYRAK